jgi:hypothetical protein
VSSCIVAQSSSAHPPAYLLVAAACSRPLGRTSQTVLFANPSLIPLPLTRLKKASQVHGCAAGGQDVRRLPGQEYPTRLSAAVAPDQLTQSRQASVMAMPQRHVLWISLKQRTIPSITELLSTQPRLAMRRCISREHIGHLPKPRMAPSLGDPECSEFSKIVCLIQRGCGKMQYSPTLGLCLFSVVGLRKVAHI